MCSALYFLRDFGLQSHQTCQPIAYLRDKFRLAGALQHCWNTHRIEPMSLHILRVKSPVLRDQSTRFDRQSNKETPSAKRRHRNSMRRLKEFCCLHSMSFRELLCTIHTCPVANNVYMQTSTEVAIERKQRKSMDVK